MEEYNLTLAVTLGVHEQIDANRAHPMFPRSILVRVGDEDAFGDGNNTETTDSGYMAEYDSGVSASSVSLVDTQELSAFDDSDPTGGTFPGLSPSVSSASSDSESSEMPNMSRHGSYDTAVPSASHPYSDINISPAPVPSLSSTPSSSSSVSSLLFVYHPRRPCFNPVTASGSVYHSATFIATMSLLTSTGRHRLLRRSRQGTRSSWIRPVLSLSRMLGYKEARRIVLGWGSSFLLFRMGMMARWLF